MYETFDDKSHHLVLTRPIYRFPLKSCPPFLSKDYIDEVSELEPILPNGRNLDFREFRSSISFNPYIPLISFDSVKSRTFRKKVLIDVGSNGFSSSTKQLIDNYASSEVIFDEVIMFEPSTNGMEEGIDFYKPKTDIKFYNQYISFGTRDPVISAKIKTDDYLVLKFDVDERTIGPTMEWGFLGDLLYSQEIALVDELYIELHYRNRNGRPFWKHYMHSARQRYDVVRQLRSCGMAIHDWP